MLFPKKYSNILVGFFMAFFMSMIMSFAMLLINVGWHDWFFSHWLKSWASAFIVAYVALLVIRPLTMYIVGKIVK